MAFNLKFQTKHILKPWCILFHRAKVPLKVFFHFIWIPLSVLWVRRLTSIIEGTIPNQETWYLEVQLGKKRWQVISKTKYLPKKGLLKTKWKAPQTFFLYFRYHQPYKGPNAAGTGSNSGSSASNPVFRVRLSVGNIEVTGEGSTAQAAKHSAATNALQKLKENPMPAASRTSAAASSASCKLALINPLGTIHKWCLNFGGLFWPPSSPLSEFCLLAPY